MFLFSEVWKNPTDQTSKLSVIYSRMTFIETFRKSENLDWNFDIESLKSLIQLAVDKIKLLRQRKYKDFPIEAAKSNIREIYTQTKIERNSP